MERQYHTDEQGTVLAISDDSQATAVTYQTDAWGTVQSGSATDQPLDYVGGLGYQRDPDSGLQYVRARHYDPTTGEWLNQDPIEGEAPYAFVYNSPTAFVDPSGMFPLLGRIFQNPPPDMQERIRRNSTPEAREQRFRQTMTAAASIGAMLIPGKTPRGKMGTV